MVLTLLFTASVTVLLVVDIIKNPDAAINKYHIVIAISVVFLIISIIGYYRKPFFFHFNDKTDVLIFRFYPVGFFNARKNSAQIPKEKLVKYEIKKSFFGREEKLILYQNFRSKVASYPPISLSAVDKTDREKLKRTLDKYVQK